MAKEESSTPEASKPVDTQEAPQPAQSIKSQSPFAKPVESKKEDTKKTEEAPTDTPKHLDVQALGSNLVKIKVDGKEEDVPFAELLKGYQTNAHNTQTAQTNSVQAKEFELREKELELREKEMSARMEAIEQRINPPEKEDPYAGVKEDDRWVAEAIDPVLKAREEAINKKLAELDARTQALDPYIQAMQPQIVENNFKQADAFAKEEGFEGLLENRSKLEDMYIGLAPEKQQILQSQGVQGIVSLYKDMKLKEFQAQMSQPQPAGVTTESAGGVTPAPSQDDEYRKKYLSTLAEAQANAELGRTSGNMQDLLKLKLGDKL